MTTDRQPTIEELRRVAKYMADAMGLHSAAGKLNAKADLLERYYRIYLPSIDEGEGEI